MMALNTEMRCPLITTMQHSHVLHYHSSLASSLWLGTRGIQGTLRRSVHADRFSRSAEPQFDHPRKLTGMVGSCECVWTHKCLKLLPANGSSQVFRIVFNTLAILPLLADQSKKSRRFTLTIFKARTVGRKRGAGAASVGTS
jgi:hypothetical protein